MMGKAGTLVLSFTQGGVTQALLARAFGQPTVAQFLRGARRGDWFFILDISKAFYNFRLRLADRRVTGFVCPFTW